MWLQSASLAKKLSRQFLIFWLLKKIVPSETQHFFSSTLTAFMMVQAKLNIPSTLNIDTILWLTQLIGCAVKCEIMVQIMGYLFHFISLCMCISFFKFQI